MAKMTKEEKKAKLLEKKEAAKAKKAAKRAAALEKKRKQAEAKKAKREAKKAKKLAKLEKEKAKKAKLREKKRLAKEKQAALKTAKTVKIAKKADAVAAGIDIKEAAKNVKLAMAQIASQLASLDDNKRAKKAKSIAWMGYDVETADGNVTVRFTVEKTKKANVVDAGNEQPKKARKPRQKTKAEEPSHAVVDTADVEAAPANEEEPQNVEVPAGDLYGQNGNPTGEVANIEDDDNPANEDEDEDGTSDEEDDFISDSRDEQNEDIIDNRREFFGSVDDDGELTDD